ncbi:MAG: tetratricopeptide repeat protein [bacterium]|nr:tetratricopeptide repeat protein [bacterium]
MTTAVEINDRIEKCQKILDTDPNSQIFAALAEALRKKGDLDKAFRVCRTGLKIHPDCGSAHLVMAKINLDRGLFDWAEIEVNKASKTDGHTRAIELLKAEILIYKGEFAKAVNLLKRLLEINPNDSQINKLLEIARKLPEEQTVITNSASAIPGPVDSATEKAANSAPVKETTVRLSTAQLVERAITLPGIDGVLFVNLEGLVVESQWTLKLDESTCGAIMAETGKAVAQELMQNSFGEVQTILIESEDLMFYQMNMEDGFFLFASRCSSNLGSIRMKIENLLNGNIK